MTQSDRGAYPPERPLAFDGYAARPRGGPAPVTLILSMLVLLGVGGGVFYLYRGGARAPGGPPEPVGAPVGDLKIAAPPQAQAPDPASGLTIYKDNPNATAAAPAFTAPPEQPTPRPAEAAAAPASVLYPVTPTPVTATPIAPASAPSAPDGESQWLRVPSAKHAKVADRSTPSWLDAAPIGPPLKHRQGGQGETTTAPTVRVKHAAVTTDTIATSAAKPKHAAAQTAADPAATPKHAVATADAPSSAKHAGGYIVQIGAFSSQELADKSWTSAAGVAPGAMAGKGKRVAQVTKDGATLYRTAITGFDSRADAQALCAKLTAAGRTCFVR